MPNLVTIKMQNPPAIPAVLALSTQKSPTRFHEDPVIEKRYMTAAVALWLDYFWPHARAALRQIGRSDRHTDARRILRWIKAQGKVEISREEIRREALGQRLDAEQVQAVLDRLEKAGWLKLEKIRTTGRSIYRWQVNPALLKDACG